MGGGRSLQSGRTFARVRYSTSDSVSIPIPVKVSLPVYEFFLEKIRPLDWTDMFLEQSWYTVFVCVFILLDLLLFLEQFIVKLADKGPAIKTERESVERNVCVQRRNKACQRRISCSTKFQSRVQARHNIILEAFANTHDLV